jgi:hypothetical protein
VPCYTFSWDHWNVDVTVDGVLCTRTPVSMPMVGATTPPAWLGSFGLGELCTSYDVSLYGLLQELNGNQVWITNAGVNGAFDPFDEPDWTSSLWDPGAEDAGGFYSDPTAWLGPSLSDPIYGLPAVLPNGGYGASSLFALEYVGGGWSPGGAGAIPSSWVFDCFYQVGVGSDFNITTNIGLYGNYSVEFAGGGGGSGTGAIVGGVNAQLFEGAIVSSCPAAWVMGPAATGTPTVYFTPDFSDGRWHRIGVTFSPGGTSSETQCVDGDTPGFLHLQHSF